MERRRGYLGGRGDFPGYSRRLGATLLSWHSVERSTNHWGDGKKQAVAVTPKPCLLKFFPWARNSVILHQVKLEGRERFWWAVQPCLRLAALFPCGQFVSQKVVFSWGTMGCFSPHFHVLVTCCNGKERPSRGVSSSAIYESRFTLFHAVRNKPAWIKSTAHYTWCTHVLCSFYDFNWRIHTHIDLSKNTSNCTWVMAAVFLAMAVMYRRVVGVRKPTENDFTLLFRLTQV